MEPPNPMPIVHQATARAADKPGAPGQNRNTSVSPTKAPAIIAPVSWPYCPRIPQPNPPASADNTIACQALGEVAWLRAGDDDSLTGLFMRMAARLPAKRTRAKACLTMVGRCVLTPPPDAHSHAFARWIHSIVHRRLMT